VLRGRSVTLARQETWALLLAHNMTATLAARAAGQAGLDPDLIPFTAVLSLIRGHVTADTCCPHCGKRPASGNDPIALLVSQILAQPAHRDRPARTSGRTAFQRQHWHTEEVTYTITIVPSNLPKADIRPGSLGQWAPVSGQSSRARVTRRRRRTAGSDHDHGRLAKHGTRATHGLCETSRHRSPQPVDRGPAPSFK
jgi:hypothetical protein